MILMVDFDTPGSDWEWRLPCQIFNNILQLLSTFCLGQSQNIQPHHNAHCFPGYH